MGALLQGGRMVAGLMAAFLMAGSVVAYEQPLLLRGDLAAGHDSNVANAGVSADQRSDLFAEASFSANRLYAAGLFVSLELEALLRARAYRDYPRLSHVAPGGLLRVNYRPGGGFHTPTLSGWSSYEHRKARSDLREGSIHRLGVSLRQPLTTRLTGRLNGHYTWRRADNAVFEYEFGTVGLELVWEPASGLVLHAGATRREGGLVSGSRDDPDLKNASRDWLADDAFAEAAEEQLVYRLRASVTQYTMGVNHSFRNGTSLDMQIQTLDARGSYGAGYRRTLVFAGIAHGF